MFKFICVYIQVESYHNKQVTQRMGTNRKYSKRKRSKKKAGPEAKDDSDENIVYGPAENDDNEQTEENEVNEQPEENEVKELPEDNEDNEEPDDQSDESEPEVEVKSNKQTTRSNKKASKQPPTKTCYKCNATEASGACQHQCYNAGCMVACCGPLSGCSVVLESDTEKNYFCFKCWAKLIKNTRNKKHIIAAKVGTNLSKSMFVCKKSLKNFNDLQCLH